jgi:hypothetical protein
MRVGKRVTINSIRSKFRLNVALRRAGAVMALIPQYATGSTRGINSPPTNPMVDYVGRLGKNLVDIFAVGNAFVTTTYVGNKLRFSANSVPSVTTPYFANRNFQLNERYTISGIWSQPTTISNNRFKFVYTDGTSTVQAQAPTTTPTTFSFTSEVGKTIDYIAIHYGTSGNYTEVENLQLELGTTATTYEPYGYNNALLQGFGFVPNSGYDLLPFVNSNGVDVGYGNIVLNPTFVNTTAWVASAFSFSVSSNEATLLASAQFATLQPSAKSANKDERYYARGEIKASSNAVSLRVYDGSAYVTKLHSGGGNYEVLSVICTIPNNTPAFRESVILDARASGWTTVNAKNMMTIRLDNNPQVIALETQLQRQLTALECDRLFPFVATTGNSKIANRVVLSADGVDDRTVNARNYGNIASNQDFALCWGGLMPASWSTGFVFCNNLSDATTRVLASLIDANGSLGTHVANILVNTSAVATLIPNEVYDFRLIRRSGSLKLEVYDSKGNKATIFTVANTSALTWQPNTRLFCRSNSADGTANTGFLKLGLAWCTLHIGTGVVNVDKTIDRIARDYRTVI